MTCKSFFAYPDYHYKPLLQCLLSLNLVMSLQLLKSNLFPASHLLFQLVIIVLLQLPNLIFRLLRLISQISN